MAKTGLAQKVKERPILFSGPMVRAILEGRKTQTRRVVKWKPREEGLNLSASSLSLGFYCTGVPSSGYVLGSRDGRGVWNDRTYPLHCPYGNTGTRLWVRETWRERGSAQREDGKLGVGPSFYRDALYRADGHEYDGPWRPSIFMPRQASRITLEILGVRVERLRDITAADVVAEGIGESWWPTSNLCAQWEKGWDAINGKRPGCAWKDNPWVWVLSFKRITA